MALAWYTEGKNYYLRGDVHWDTDTIHVQLLDTGYTYSAAHGTMETASFPAATREGDSTALASKTVSGGIADAADTTITNVATSQSVNALVVYLYNTGTSSSDIPLFYVDAGTGFTLTTDGNNVLLTWAGGGLIS